MHMVCVAMMVMMVIMMMMRKKKKNDGVTSAEITLDHPVNQSSKPFLQVDCVLLLMFLCFSKSSENSKKKERGEKKKNIDCEGGNEESQLFFSFSFCFERTSKPSFLQCFDFEMIPTLSMIDLKECPSTKPNLLPIFALDSTTTDAKRKCGFIRVFRLINQVRICFAHLCVHFWNDLVFVCFFFFSHNNNNNNNNNGKEKGVNKPDFGEVKRGERSS